MVKLSKDRRQLLKALGEIEEALGENVERSLEIQRRVNEFHVALESGASVHELIAAEESPRTVEMLTENMAILETVGAEFRATLAHALRAEGLVIEAIAELYGVTRQRVSALLKQ